MAHDLEIHQTVDSLVLAHKGLQTAYCELSQMQADWPKALNEYLYDEEYGGVKAEELVNKIANFLSEINGPYWKLTTDCRDLSDDLLRVGRGDGFRV